MTTFQQLCAQLPKETARVKKMANTLQGLQSIIALYESHFNQKYTHGDNVVYDIARVNILRKLKNETPLC